VVAISARNVVRRHRIGEALLDDTERGRSRVAIVAVATCYLSTFVVVDYDCICQFDWDICSTVNSERDLSRAGNDAKAGTEDR
jgi:hypothetical protein